MYKVRDIQTRYGVGEGTVLGWIKAGDLKAVNVGKAAGKQKARWRITQAALDAFEQSRTLTAPAPHTRRQKPANVVEFYQ